MSQLWTHQTLAIAKWVLIPTLSVASYANSCWGDFVFDDIEAVVTNKDVNPGSSLIDVLTNDFWGTNVFKNNSHKSYRPLTILTFYFNFWLAGGLNPFFFHLTNVLIHPIACILYYEVCQRLCTYGCTHVQQTEWSLCPIIASLMFAVHPVHTESVAGVVGRAELMSAVFYFLAFICYMKSVPQKGMLLQVLGTFATVALAGCAMLFKEQGLTVLGLCLVFDALYAMKVTTQWRSCAARVTLLSLCTVAIFAARMTTGSPKFKPSDNPASFSNSWITRALHYNYLYAFNCWLLLNPSWLCFDWSMGCIPLLESVFDFRVLAVVIFWLAFGLLLLFGVLRKNGHYKRLVLISLAMVIVPFLPAANLLVHVGFVVAERVLYLPSSGWCLLVALGFTLMIKYYKTICVPVFIMLILTYVVKSIQRSGQWQTDDSLFVSGLGVCSQNAKVFYNIGKVKADAGQVLVAEAAYRRAVMLYPEYDQALNNLGNLLKETNQIVESEQMLERATGVNAEFAAAWMNLGIVKATLNKTEEAESCYQKALRFRRKYPDAYYNLGNLYIDCGRTSDAIAAFQSAISLQRDHINSWSNLALLYENKGQYRDAERVLREAIEEMPGHPQFYYSLGVLMGRLHRLEEGKELLNKAILMAPTTANYHANLGVIYHLMKDYDKAEEVYSYALQLDSNLAVARDNLSKLLKSKHKRQ